MATEKTDILYATLAAGESYASVADIVNADDIAQATVEIPRWKKDGTSLKLLVRGLDLEQQERISDQARKKDRLTGDIVKDRVRFAAATLREACVQPRLTDAQAAGIAEKNATVVQAIVTFIWNTLTYQSPDEIVQIVHALASLPAEPGDSTSLLDE
jgi:hypothetical protein